MFIMRYRRPLIIVLVVLLVFAAAGTWLRAHHVVPILMYHNVMETDALRADTVSPRILDYQLDYLRRNNYQVIPLAVLVNAIREGKYLPPRSVVLTFDDGHTNNYLQAFPIIKKYGYPAIFFVSPGTVGQEDFMGWAEILEMQSAGLTFGSHGMYQEYLPDASPEVLEQEVVTSKKILEEKLKTPVEFYCYPVGGFHEQIKNKIRDAGYAGAVTTNRGGDRFNRDVFELKRIRVSDRDKTPLVLWAKLSGYYNLLRKMKAPY